MQNKKDMSIIFGGTSNEHSISIKTASFMYKSLIEIKKTVQPIFISQAGDWYIPQNPPFFFPHSSIGKPQEFMKKFCEKNDIERFNKIPSFISSKIAFIALHGGEGENGTIQGFLNMLKIPFVGSDLTASSLAMNKLIANQIFQYHNFPVPKFQMITKQDFSQKPQTCNLPFPIFIKPISGGSSLNSFIIEKEEIFLEQLNLFFQKEEQDCLLQEYISGKEVTCCVIERKKGEIISLPITEIQTKSSFFDFESKYKKGKAIEITPAEIDKNLYEMIQKMSIQAHKFLQCKDYSRSDFIIQNNKPYILELNTLPGMTETSFLPQQLKAAGISFYDFFDYFIKKYTK